MIEIRAALSEDIRQISYIHVDTWRSAYRGIIDQSVLDRLSYHKSQENWHHCRSRMTNIFYVAEDDKAVVGFVVGGRQRDEDLLYEGEVYGMYILPEYQRQGIGHQLLHRIVQDFAHEGWKDFLIWCLKRNPCKSFYEKEGGILLESSKIKIGGKPLVKNGYVFEVEGYLTRNPGLT